MDNRGLRLFIVEGKELKGSDNGGSSSDPYVKLKFNGDSFKTETIKNTLSPVWNQSFDMGMVNEYSTFEIECLDWDRFGKHDSLGKVQLPMTVLREAAIFGQSDKWVNLDKKGYIRVGFQFNPPYPLQQQQHQISPDGSNPNVIQQNQIQQQNIISSYGQLPPPVYYEPIYLKTYPTKLEAEFILPNDLYQKTIYVTGEPVKASLILYVNQPIIVRSLFVSLKGKTSIRGKKQKELVQDYRNLLHSTTGPSSPNSQTQKIALDIGKHIYPFEFFIPKHCNSSIDGIGNYKVSYRFQFNADIVNLPDIELEREITVVNLEDTVHRMTQTQINERCSKSPITGGNIEMTISAPKNSYYPGEDIELQVHVNNSSKKKVKKIELELQRTITIEHEKGVPSQVLKVSKNFFPKIRQNQESTQIVVMETPQNLLNTIYQSGIIKIEYKVRAVLDILDCIDLYTLFPVNIVLPDPKRVILPNPLDEISKIPRYIQEWTPRNLLSWLYFRMKCPEVVTANPEFYQYCLSGNELLSIPDNILLEKVLKGAGSRTEEIFKAIKIEIDRVLSVRSILKDNQLPHLIPTFEKEMVTFDLLPTLTPFDLGQLTTTIGDRIRLQNAFKNISLN
ncbi:hypothetical protein RB653_001961 [Dictyostelium firmibasis]|uniref:C2 domain-containing protein n=1 Tax=Dictyostelium firmibasis TaxID=79012 RepID=A0AAN7YML7_9MYCE